MNKLRGWIRLYVWGLCPKCNSDSPEVYDCTICNYLPRYRSNQKDIDRAFAWSKFKEESDE